MFSSAVFVFNHFRKIDITALEKNKPKSVYVLDSKKNEKVNIGHIYDR